MRAHDALRNGLGRRAHRHPMAVRTLIRAARHRIRDARAETRLLVAEHSVRRHERAHDLKERLEQVHVDDLTDAAVHRDHRGERGRERGDLVGQRDRRQQRRAVGLTVERGEARHRLGQRGEPRTMGVRPVLTEPGDPSDHQLRVGGEQDVGCEPEPFERSRPEVLDEDIGAGAQPAHHREVVRVLEVERDRSLVAVQQLEEQRVAVGMKETHRAGGVSAVGPFDLDHVGAEVCEVARAVRAGHDGAGVDHAKVGERSGGHCASLPQSSTDSSSARASAETPARSNAVASTRPESEPRSILRR